MSQRPHTAIPDRFLAAYQCIERLALHDRYLAAYIFGSFARAEATKYSDLDVCVIVAGASRWSPADKRKQLRLCRVPARPCDDLFELNRGCHRAGIKRGQPASAGERMSLPSGLVGDVNVTPRR